MKNRLNFFTLSILLFLLTFVTGCASIQTLETEGLKTVDFSKVEELENIANLEQMIKGEVVIEEPFVVKIPKGFELPVHFELNTPLAVMNSQCSTMSFFRDLYGYFSEDQILLSPDKKQWAPISNIELIKKLFGAGDGELAIGLGAGKEKGPLLEVKLMIHQQAQPSQE